MTILASTPPTTSEAILTTLMAEAGNERRKDTLIRLKEACDYLVATGTPFQLTNVQRVIENKFGKEAGPKAQSISNERKRPLGMYHYVEARERELQASKLPSRSIQPGRSEAVARAIDRIDDIDTRSAMHDLYDRLVVAEKSLARAKVVFKTLGRGADWEHLISGQERQEGAVGLPISEELVVALQRLVRVLTDNGKLEVVGLHYDGRRVRRKTGTRDELLDPKTLEGVQVLAKQLLAR
ncbi:hypothetical protein [Chromobacterium amazonense]|uniref:Uncharacterized protein n=1 Tax=Chromobacterium amazonense TaxID=1382803 RepID=A0ABU8V4J0_9NEIS|nr:hypothetical protein [Chromobacterium amazonense]MDQ4540325.1 hypothetical protein [Chromobacterium amazonense]